MEVNKKIISSLTNKLSKKFKGKKPNDVFRDIINNPVAAQFINNETINDVIISCFIIPNLTKETNLDQQIDMIKYKLFGFSYYEILDAAVSQTCGHCGGEGTERCDRCDGDGEEYDSEEEDNYVTCSDCGGDGDVTCSWCGGSGEDENETLIDYTRFYLVSYNDDLLFYLQSLKRGDELYFNEIFDDYGDEIIVLSSFHILGEIADLNVSDDDEIFNELNTDILLNIKNGNVLYQIGH